jgi:hypothetical protein
VGSRGVFGLPLDDDPAMQTIYAHDQGLEVMIPIFDRAENALRLQTRRLFPSLA